MRMGGIEKKDFYRSLSVWRLAIEVFDNSKFIFGVCVITFYQIPSIYRKSHIPWKHGWDRCTRAMFHDAQGTSVQYQRPNPNNIIVESGISARIAEKNLMYMILLLNFVLLRRNWNASIANSQTLISLLSSHHSLSFAFFVLRVWRNYEKSKLCHVYL